MGGRLHSLWLTARHAVGVVGRELLPRPRGRRPVSPAAVVDRALLGVARATHGAFVDSDPIARERLHLPARANGGGLRSLVKSAPAAFAATVAKIAPKLIESKDDQGAVRRGFLDGVA